MTDQDESALWTLRYAKYSVSSRAESWVCNEDGVVVHDRVQHDAFHKKLDENRNHVARLLTVIERLEKVMSSARVVGDALIGAETASESAAESSEDEPRPITLTLRRTTLDDVLDVLRGVFTDVLGPQTPQEFQHKASRASLALHEAIRHAERDQSLEPVNVQDQGTTTLLDPVTITLPGRALSDLVALVGQTDRAENAGFAEGFLDGLWTELTRARNRAISGDQQSIMPLIVDVTFPQQEISEHPVVSVYDSRGTIVVGGVRVRIRGRSPATQILYVHDEGVNL